MNEYYILNPHIILRNEKDYFDTFIAYNYRTSTMKSYTEYAFKILECISNEAKSMEEIENFSKDFENLSKSDIQDFILSQIKAGFIQNIDIREKRDLIDILPLIKHFNFKIPYLTSPASIDLFITSKCNLNCVHCFARQPLVSQTELPLRTLIKLVDEMERMRVLEVRITGGEPTLHSDIMKFLDHLSKKQMRCVILTNGNNVKREIIKKLKDSHVIPTISLDSSRAEIYNSFRGNQQAFQKVIRTFELLNELDVDFGINCCVMNKNKNNLEEIIEFVIDYNAKKIAFLDVIPLLESNLQKEWVPSFQEYESIPDYKKELDHKFKNKIEIVFLMGTCSEFREMKDIRNEIVACPAGIRTMSIFSDGKIYPCNIGIGLEEVCMGNIYEQSLNKIWHHEQWKNFRGDNTYKNLKTCIKCEKFVDCKDKHCRLFPFKILGDFYAPHPKCRLE